MQGVLNVNGVFLLTKPGSFSRSLTTSIRLLWPATQRSRGTKNSLPVSLLSRPQPSNVAWIVSWLSCSSPDFLVYSNFCLSVETAVCRRKSWRSMSSSRCDVLPPWFWPYQSSMIVTGWLWSMYTFKFNGEESCFWSKANMDSDRQSLPSETFKQVETHKDLEWIEVVRGLPEEQALQASHWTCSARQDVQGPLRPQKRSVTLHTMCLRYLR